MKFKVITITLSILFFVAGYSYFLCQKPKTIDVYFSPKGGCTEAIIKNINKAKKTIQVQAYSFTSASIANALIEAKNNGKEILVILDDSNLTDKYSLMSKLYDFKVPVIVDSKHKISHNKIIIIDEEIIITGSFNFSKSAEESNAENLLIINNKGLAKKYIDNFHYHESHSNSYNK